MPDRTVSVKSKKRSRVVVRNAVPDDREKIFEHFSRVWDPEVAREKIKSFDWLFMENPFNNKEISDIFIISDGKKIFGITLSTPVDILVKGKEQRIVWWGSTSIDEEYRGRATSLRLSRRMRDLKVYGIGYPLERVVPIYKKFSSPEDPLYVVGKFGFSVKPLRIDKVIPVSFLRPPVNFLFSIADKTITRMKTNRVSGNIDVNELHRFPESFDDWFDSVRNGYRDLIIMKLGYKYLNWRYLDAPIRKYTAFELRSKGSFRGFYVMEEYKSFGIPTCAIVEFFAARDDDAAFDRIMSHAINEARRRRAFFLKVFESYVPQFRSLYKKFGFLHGKGSRYPMIIYLPPSLQPDSVNKPEYYFFSRGFADPKII